MALLQGVGRHRRPLAAGVDEQDVTLTDALRILPWEREEERGGKKEEGRLGEEERKDW